MLPIEHPINQARTPTSSLIDHPPRSLRLARRVNLKRLLKPRHIAFIGGRTVEAAITMARSAGFTGEIWPVHPNHETLAGIPAFKSINDLPEGPDAAFLYVPKSITADVIRSLASAGGGGVICFAAGFAELGSEGLHLQQELAAAAGPLALVGPNSTGLLNLFDNVALWPVSEHQPQQLQKGVAIISSSGGMLFNYTVNHRSIGAGYLISVGNQAALDYSDYIDAVIDDPRVMAIGLIVEGLGDVVTFSEAAVCALARNVPIVAVKSGASEVGARMAQTHSGALVATDDLVQALFERVGVIRVTSIPALGETLKMMTTTQIPKGRRVVVLTTSGGEKALTADAAANTVIEFPAPSAPVTAKLEKQIPDFAVVSNPFDYNAYFSGSGVDVLSSDNPTALERCFRTIVDDGYDVAMLLARSRTYQDGSYDPPGNTVDAWIAANRNSGRAVAMASMFPEHLPREHRELLIQNGVAPLQGLDDAITAIDGAIRWGEMVESLKRVDPKLLSMPAAPRITGPGRLLDEAESKHVLAAYGLVVPNGRIAQVAAAPETAQALGFPVAVKALKPLIAHKAKAGAVALGLVSAEHVARAVEAMSLHLAARGVELAEVLVEPMVEDPVAELIAGVKYDRQFGHALVFGRGGVAVELLRDIRTILLPVDENILECFVRRTPIGTILAERAIDNIVRALVSISSFVADHRANLVSLDINPLLVTGTGEIIAVDALVEISDENQR